MSQWAVEKAIGKLITDEAFRELFFAKPAVACLAAGLDLSPVELEALSHLSKPALERFSRRLDDRICRLPVVAERSPRPAGGQDGEGRTRTTSHKGSETAQCARTPGAGDDMASLDALNTAGGGADSPDDL